MDLNAIDRQPRIAELIAARPAIYADANRKLHEGFDYVELDPAGEIGLVTTGAGLSMMLIDELTARGAKPLNFCDIRTGQMRGSPARLMRVLEWITARPSLRAVLVNIFAGITDLAEFADLLATAVEQTPALRVPVVARLIGRGAEQAKRILAERQPDMLVTEDLEEAMARGDGQDLAAQGSPPPVAEMGRAVNPKLVLGRTTRSARSWSAPDTRLARGGSHILASDHPPLSLPCSPAPRQRSCRASPAAWAAPTRR